MFIALLTKRKSPEARAESTEELIGMPVPRKLSLELHEIIQRENDLPVEVVLGRQIC